MLHPGLGLPKPYTLHPEASAGGRAPSYKGPRAAGRLRRQKCYRVCSLGRVGGRRRALQAVHVLYW